MHFSYRGTALEKRVNRSAISEMNQSKKVSSFSTMINCVVLRDRKSEDQSEANGMSKGSGSNSPSKAHVSQQLELLASAPARVITSKRSSIFVLLLSSINLRSTTHAHLICSKTENGMVLYQIENVARNRPSLVLSCQSTAHRDSFLKNLAEHNVNHGWNKEVTLSVEKAEENDASISAQWLLPIKSNISNSAIFEAIERSFQTSAIPQDFSTNTLLIFYARPIDDVDRNFSASCDCSMTAQIFLLGG